MEAEKHQEWTPKHFFLGMNLPTFGERKRLINKWWKVKPAGERKCWNVLLEKKVTWSKQGLEDASVPLFCALDVKLLPLIRQHELLVTQNCRAFLGFPCWVSAQHCGQTGTFTSLAHRAQRHETPRANFIAQGSQQRNSFPPRSVGKRSESHSESGAACVLSGGGQAGVSTGGLTYPPYRKDTTAISKNMPAMEMWGPVRLWFYSRQSR